MKEVIWVGNGNPYISSFSPDVEKAEPILAELLGIDPGDLCYTLIGIDGSGRIQPIVMANTKDDGQVVSVLSWVLAKITGRYFMDKATLNYDLAGQIPET